MKKEYMCIAESLYCTAEINSVNKKKNPNSTLFADKAL